MFLSATGLVIEAGFVGPGGDENRPSLSIPDARHAESGYGTHRLRSRIVVHYLDRPTNNWLAPPCVRKWDRFNPRKERCSERECCDRQMFNCALRDSHRELDELRRNVSLEVTEIRVLPESLPARRQSKRVIAGAHRPSWEHAIPGTCKPIPVSIRM